ncbi:hypothetical protein HAX54_026974, partial [Datura stramonium]|nr:hypothetical protein [Datura stramonium]
LNQMVNFRDYTSPSSKFKYLIIESTESSMQTKLLVQTPLTRWHAGPWPLLRNSLYMTNWTSKCKLTSVRSSQTWSLQSSHHRYTNIASALPSLGLPIRGSFYKEVIPEAIELTCVDAKDQRYIPRVCKYLFTDFHYLQESKTDSSRVSLSKWIGFWYKKALRYEPALPRREKKTAHLKSMHNPTRAIPETSQWSRDEEGVFSKLGVKPAKKEETYLEALLPCWLCAFVRHSEEGDFTRLETFKIATTMASKQKISLVVPILQASIVVSTRYALANGPSNPPMVDFSGEGVARYFDKKEEKKRIHHGDNIA